MSMYSAQVCLPWSTRVTVVPCYARGSDMARRGGGKSGGCQKCSCVVTSSKVHLQSEKIMMQCQRSIVQNFLTFTATVCAERRLKLPGFLCLHMQPSESAPSGTVWKSTV